MSERYEFTVALAKEAGEKVLAMKEEHLDVSIKNGDPRDFVTNVDIEVSNFISERIKENFPNEVIYSEEADVDVSNGSFWAIDPIDGTKNFVRGIPFFSVVIAYVESGIPIVGAVYNPVTKELFSFEKGKGAFLNGKVMKVSDRTELKESIVFLTTGRYKENWDWGAGAYRRLLEAANSTRIIASSALDICFVASGKSEACIYASLTMLDVIAAVGILREAGGVLEGKDGPIDFVSKTPQMFIAANNRQILEEIKTII